MTDFNDILKAICSRLEHLGVKMFLHTRPRAVVDKLNAFVVVEFASGLRSNVYGETDESTNFGWDSTSVGIVIFVRDKMKAQNYSEADGERLSELLRQAVSPFPCKDYTLGIELSRPRILVTCTSDGEGFHYARANMRVTTLVDND